MIDNLYTNKNQTAVLSIISPDNALGEYSVTVKADELKKHKTKELFILISKEETPLKNMTKSGSEVMIESESEEISGEIIDYIFLTVIMIILLIVGWFYYNYYHFHFLKEK